MKTHGPASLLFPFPAPSHKMRGLKTRQEISRLCTRLDEPTYPYLTLLQTAAAWASFKPWDVSYRWKNPCMKTVLGLEAEAGSWPFGWEILGYRVTREGLEEGMTLALDGHNPSVPEFLVLCKVRGCADRFSEAPGPENRSTSCLYVSTCVCIYVCANHCCLCIF